MPASQHVDLWPYEIAHAQHRILDPFSDAKMLQLGRLAGLRPGQRVLDLACGRGEMLCRWAQQYGIGGLGVDLSVPQIDDARARADELGVTHLVEFVQADAASFAADAQDYDVAACIGATWIGGGLAGTLALLRPALRADGVLLIGEVFWRRPPSASERDRLGLDEASCTDLAGRLDVFERAGLELTDMLLADDDDFDRYEAQQWATISAWLRAHPDDPRGPRMREFLDTGRRTYLEAGRGLLGWGVFVLRDR